MPSSEFRSRSDRVTSSVVRISIAPSSDFSFSQFLVLAERPILIHTGRAAWFHSIFEHVSEYVDPSRLGAITFSHFEADECGGLNEWLKIAPNAQVFVGRFGEATAQDYSSKMPVTLKDGESIDLGSKKLVLIETPHFPHNWDACMFYEPEEKVLFCSDLGANIGFGELFLPESRFPELIEFQRKTGYLCGGEVLRSSLEKLRKLDIEMLAIHHGALIQGESAILQFFSMLEAEFGGTGSI
jgi:flavorubredoxin